MRQQAFEQIQGERWRRFERQIAYLDRLTGSIERARQPTRDRSPGPGHGGPPSRAGGDDDDVWRPEEFPQLYREVCRDLSLANQRRYSPQLLDRLNDLALSGHRQLYRRDTDFARSFLAFVIHGFPASVRAEWRAIAISAAAFLLPGLTIFLFVLAQPELVYSVVSPEKVSEFEMMYDPTSDRVGTNRPAESDIEMFGFYIMNNIGIAFQAFASGLVWGVGSIFFMVFNGLLIGALSAHVLLLGYDETFFSFVIGHGSFELSAIVIAGGAGLKLGYALIAPGRRSRTQSLRNAAGESMPLVYGVIAMLLVAALLEAFWSSKGVIIPEIKYAVGASLWAVVFLYFMLTGRRGGGR